MTRHRLPALAAGLLAAAALAAPATAAADTTLTAGPLKVRDYKLTLIAVDGAKDSLAVQLARTAGGSTQLHMYSFASGVTVKAGGAKPTIAAKLGRYGSVKLTLGATTATRGSVPAGCSGSAGRQEKGSFGGALKLVLDTTYFRTVSARSLPGSRLSGGSLRCDGGSPVQQSGLMLSAMPSAGDAMLMFSAARDGAGKVTQQALRSDAAAQTAPASIMHMISASAAASSFTSAADLSTAAVTGAGPFLTGTLAYSGEGSGGVSSGIATGSFAAKFDSIGTQSLPADTTATLMQR